MVVAGMSEGRSHRLSRIRRVALAGAAAVALAAPGVAAAAPAPARAPVPASPDLGANVLVFTPSMSTAQIQARVDAVAAQQVGNEMGTQRYALLFEPGTYGTPTAPLVFQVGYYTEVAGLGQQPGDVTINGSVDVYNQCDATGYCTALNNFWRSVSNLTIDVAGGTDCHANTEFWAVSQAAPLRRVQVDGTTSLMDYCTGPSYASGGFIADSAFSTTVINGSQQQFYTRNSVLGGPGWSNGVWNQVFSGVVGAPAQSFPDPPYTVLDTTPASREKPYLYADASGRYRVFVPAAQTDSSGTSWGGGTTPGRSLPLSDFFVARPSDPVSRINAALARGKDLLFTPGVYAVDRTIAVKRAGTVVLGLGFATLTAENGLVPMTVADVQGVDVAGLVFDAGTESSPALLQVGSGHDKGGPHRADPANPTSLQDVFFRVGGPHLGRATTSLVVNTDGTLLDDAWVWRADHGAGVGWTSNTADTGVVVNGDDVTATGLFVEHFQKYDTIWNGERGRTVFYQNEMPYDAPDQAAWRHGAVLGWAAYEVADSVRTHQAWGLGSYIYTNVDPTLHATQAFEVPRTPGVQLHDLVTVSLNAAGTIDSVVDGVGAPVVPERSGQPSDVVSYP